MERLLKNRKIEEVIRYRQNLETILEERKAAREAEMKQLLENREADFREEQNRYVFFINLIGFQF